MIKNIISLLLICLMLPACSVYRIASEDVSSKYYQSKEMPSAIEYVENVVRPHEVIGFVTVNTERNQKMSEIIEKMKKEAAVIGGDAITNITSNATGIWKKVPPQKLLGNAYLRANFTATVVAYQ